MMTKAMMMRRTKKYIAAIKAFRLEGTKTKSPKENADLYAWLEGKGYWWDVENGEWTNRKQPSNSIFKTDDDEASGVIRLRVMAHPDDIEMCVRYIKRTPNVRTIEVSEPYPNRKGSGVRVYLTCLLDAQS